MIRRQPKIGKEQNELAFLSGKHTEKFLEFLIGFEFISEKSVRLAYSGLFSNQLNVYSSGSNDESANKNF